MTPDHKGLLVVVMGVSGCGKSTLAESLAKSLDLPYVDGDALHPQSNIAKMSRGEPLNDADREPWLQRIRSRAEQVYDEETHRITAAPGAAGNLRTPAGLVVACSSLKRSYRSILRKTDVDESGKLKVDTDASPTLRTLFVFMKGDRSILEERMNARKGHFMKTKMLDSQLATLEDPSEEEDVFVVSLSDSNEKQTAYATEWIRGLWSSMS